jgi:hypothetical protein
LSHDLVTCMCCINTRANVNTQSVDYETISGFTIDATTMFTATPSFTNGDGRPHALKNVHLEMALMESGRVTDVKFQHESKRFIPNNVTLLGITIDSNPDMEN